MKIKFCGAAQDVTGSQFLITANGHTVLVDCGMFQGRRMEAYERNEKFLYDPAHVHAALITHAHMDHSGNIPNLVKQGFRGRIHATAATAELCGILLRDSARLQERDIEWVNKMRARRHEPPMHALYSVAEAETSLGYFQPVAYERELEVAPGVIATFRNAGHILGSSGISLDIEEGGRRCRIGIAVDVGRTNIPMEVDPDRLRDLDALVIESTYGNRLHDSFDTVDEELAVTIRQVTEAGGKIIIPSFAIGRTQLLVYLLHRLFNENRIPEIPIFVDSPMALEATEVYRKHLESLDRATERTFLRDHQDPFGFSRLTYVGTVEQSKELNGLAYPHVIIASSGMCEGGRVLHHLRNNIENPKNMILFVGYAAKNTLARKIVDGEERVRIFGEEHRVRCKVKVMEGFSAHADRRDLLDYVKMTPPSKLKQIFLVHGEEDQALPLRDGIRSMGYTDVRYPQRGETADVPDA